MTCGVPNKDELNILLAHNPKDFDVYANWGADLVFSGHTHGGMIKIFNHGLISPDRTLFPFYDGGSYCNNKISNVVDDDIYKSYNPFISHNIMIVSRGMSRGHIGFRLFNVPELVVVKFYWFGRSLND